MATGTETEKKWIVVDPHAALGSLNKSDPAPKVMEAYYLVSSPKHTLRIRREGTTVVVANLLKIL